VAAIAMVPATTKAHRQPSGMAIAGSDSPAISAPSDAPDCCAPKASPCRASATSRLSRAVTVGPPRPFATPAGTRHRASAVADSATSATAEHETAVRAAVSFMPRPAPMRSISRPEGVELSAETT
jgi:hypothetical protein